MLARLAPLFLLASALGVAGCATQKEVKFAPPGEGQLAMFEAANANYAVTKSTVVFIRAVIDERLFNQATADPSLPSLGPGDGLLPGQDFRSRAVARPYGPTGQGLQEVLLEEGTSVSDVMRANLAAAFRQAGYRATTEASEAGFNALVVDAHIKQFWAWLQRGQRGAGKGTLHAMIIANLDLSYGPSPLVVSGYASEPSGEAGTWMGITSLALQDFRMRLADRFYYLP